MPKPRWRGKRLEQVSSIHGSSYLEEFLRSNCIHRLRSSLDSPVRRLSRCLPEPQGNIVGNAEVKYDGRVSSFRMLLPVRTLIILSSFHREICCRALS